MSKQQSGRKSGHSSQSKSEAKTEMKSDAKNGSLNKPETIDAIAMLKKDHKTVNELFAKFKASNSADEKQALVKQICTELIVHTTLEEEIFYPACREQSAAGTSKDKLDEAQVEHDGAKLLIADLLTANAGAEFFDAKVHVLSEYIKHHVGEEEQSGDGIFAAAQKAGVDMDALGRRLQARKQQLLEQAADRTVERPMFRSLKPNFASTQSSQEMQPMAQQYQGRRDQSYRGGRSNDYESDYRGRERERDEQGRFMSDVDDRSWGRQRDEDQYRGSGNYSNEQERSRFYGSRERGGYDRDSFEEGESGRSQFRERDQYGRFMSEEDDEGDRYGGDYQRQYGSQYGDRERDEYGRFASESDEDNRYANRGDFGRTNRRWDYENEERDSGRYEGRGQSQGQGRGWFGDSEGHSRAAQQRGNYGSSRGESRGGQGSRGGRGEGGWFGEPRRHAQAARRGWQNR